MHPRSGLALVSLWMLAACGDGDTTGVANKPPTALAGNDITSAVGLGIRFDGSASSDADGTITSFSWDFGDGATGSDAVAIHTFAAAGSYTARLTVTDDDGATATDELVVRIVDTTPANEAPTAVMTGLGEVLEGTEVTLSAEDSVDPDGTIVAWAWDIGGVQATTKAVTHTFRTAGNVTVSLTVTDDDGATATTTGTMRVKAKPVEEAVLPASSTWSWGLVNAADRNDAACGPFQSANLTMTLSGTQLTVREGSAATYSGTYAAATRTFSAQGSVSGAGTQTIAGTFTPDFKRFDGTYHVEVGFIGCNRTRDVFGTRLTP